MTTEQWWDHLEKHREVLRDLVVRFYPGDRQHNHAISAARASALCEEVRRQTPRLDDVGANFDVMVEARNVVGLSRMLSSAWFGMPESMESRMHPGFRPLCHLLDDPPDDQELEDE